MTLIKKLNESSHLDFRNTLKDIYEHSPWIPEKAWQYRPFCSLQDLQEKMVQVVKDSTYEQKLALIQEHPNLGTRLEMSSASVKEQKGAGLNQLSEEEYELFSDLNNQYMKKFGFPFIMAVKGRTKDEIYIALKNRVANEEFIEFETALLEIYKIAFFRLEELMIVENEMLL